MKVNFFQGQTNKLDSNLNESEKLISPIDEIKRIIAELFNMRNIHFLFGSGTSCDAIPNMKGLFEFVGQTINKDCTKEAIEEFEAICGRIQSKENLEEILGILYSHKIYLNFQESGEIKNQKVKQTPATICSSLIETIESAIFKKINIDIQDSKQVLDTYKEFYRKIALRNKDLSRINVFTTNNDLFNEYALDSLNIHYINGFSGGINRFFNPAVFNYTFSKRMDTSIEKFEPVENMVFLYKLHGSINWIEDESNGNTFFKIKEVFKPERDKNNILIYPTPTKQNKSLGSPYVELFREFQKKLLEPHSTLFIVGYSFSDEHVNNVIYQALATNTTINVVIINDVEDKAISKIDDNRIFRIWGKTEESAGNKETEESTGNKGSEEKTVHYFEYIVNHLFPNIDAFKQRDNTLGKFVEFYESMKVK